MLAHLAETVIPRSTSATKSIQAYSQFYSFIVNKQFEFTQKCYILRIVILAIDFAR